MNNTETYSKEYLQELYGQGLSIKKISAKLNCSVGKLHGLFEKYQIPVRTNAEYAKLGSWTLTEYQKQKYSKIHKGKVLTAETKRKISEAKKGLFIKPTEYGGHRKKHKSGYILIYNPAHPYSTKDGYVFEHILAYESYHNCLVDRSKYAIHHINGNKNDNSKENLLLMTKSEHMSLHSKIRHLKNKEKKV